MTKVVSFARFDPHRPSKQLVFLTGSPFFAFKNDENTMSKAVVYYIGGADSLQEDDSETRETPCGLDET